MAALACGTCSTIAQSRLYLRGIAFINSDRRKYAGLSALMGNPVI